MKARRSETRKIENSKISLGRDRKDSDKVSNLVLAIRGSDEAPPAKKAQKLKREKFFFFFASVQSGFLTSWLDPPKKKIQSKAAHKDIQFRKKAERRENKKK